MLRTLALVLPCALLLTTTAQATDHRVPGLTEPIGDVYISTTVAGVIAAIHCEEGSFVEAGAVIIDLDSRIEELEVERRRLFVENMEVELARSELLLARSNSIAREEVEKKRSEFRIATAELQLAREQLAKRRVVTPIAGVVTDLPLKVGEYCEPPKVLVRIVDSRRFYCVANIDPAVGGALKVGDDLEFREANTTTRPPLVGKLTYVANVVDSASGLMRIRAVFDNPNGQVRPGVAGSLLLKN